LQTAVAILDYVINDIKIGKLISMILRGFLKSRATGRGSW